VLIDICGVDWPARENRFDVVYHLLSPRLNQRIRVKLETDETAPVPCSVEVFSAANWFEREAYDMYGILFSGHPTCACSPTMASRAIPCARISR
jgi:NADH-quinone oxidoreductase subunit C